jgi:uncharacterized protein YjiS (DUF1127 family)
MATAAPKRAMVKLSLVGRTIIARTREWARRRQEREALIDILDKHHDHLLTDVDLNRNEVEISSRRPHVDWRSLIDQ